MNGMIRISKNRAKQAIAQFESIRGVVSHGPDYDDAMESLEVMVAVGECDELLITDKLARCIYWINEYSFMSEEVHVEQVCGHS